MISFFDLSDRFKRIKRLGYKPILIGDHPYDLSLISNIISARALDEKLPFNKNWGLRYENSERERERESIIEYKKLNSTPKILKGLTYMIANVYYIHTPQLNVF